MNIILGFGTGEIEEATRIINECVDAFKAGGEDGLERVQEKYQDLANQYKIGPHPERYSLFWSVCYELFSGSRWLITFSFHHINRNHPMSPDGWAMLSTEWCAIVDKEDGAFEVKIFKQSS